MLKQLLNDLFTLFSPVTIEKLEVPEPTEKYKAIDKKAAIKVRQLENQKLQATAYANLMTEIVSTIHQTVTAAYTTKITLSNPTLIKKYQKDPAKYASKVAEYMKDYKIATKEQMDEMGAEILNVIIHKIPMIEIAQKSYLRGLKHG